VVFHTDYGTVTEVTAIRFPQEADVQSHFIKKEANPHLIYIIKEPITMIWYTDGEKGFIYDTDRIYLGNLKRSDLKRLFWRIGAILRGSAKKFD